MNSKELKEIRELLIIVDMVNGFVREGIMADPYIEHIIPEQIRLIKEFLEKKEGIAFVKDVHSEDSIEFKTFPKHCVKGTSEAEVIDELKSFEEDVLVYEKNSTSAMFAKNFLRDIDEMINLRNIVITGCCTDICDLNLAIPLKNYFNEYNREVDIYVPVNAVETYDAPNHNRAEYNEIAFKLMKQSGLKLVKKYEGNDK